MFNSLLCFLSDLSAFVTCILFDRSPSFPQRVQPWQRSVQRAANLHMAGCHTARADLFGAWCQSGYTAEGHLFWFCPRLSRSVWSRLSDARNRCYMFWPAYSRWFAVTGTGQIHHWRLYGYQYNATESGAATTTSVKTLLDVFSFLYILYTRSLFLVWFIFVFL